MDPERYNRLLALIKDPPGSSAIARAKEFGIDLTLNLRALTLTPTERLQEAQAFDEFLEGFRRGKVK